MSADSKSQQTSQPPLSQLWPGFGAQTSDINTTLGSTTNFQLASSPSLDSSGIDIERGKGQNLHNSNNNNRDYVNFNQFIMQHNLLSGGSGGDRQPDASMFPSSMGQFRQDHEYYSNIGSSNNTSSMPAVNIANKITQQQQLPQQYNNVSSFFFSAYFIISILLFDYV